MNETPFEVPSWAGWASAIITGVVAAYRIFVKGRREDMDQIKSSYLELFNKRDADYKNEVKAHKQTKEALERLNNAISMKLDVYDVLPLEMWIKDSSGIMTWFNEAYSSNFLAPMGINPSLVVGRPDEETWGKEFAETIAGHEKVVRTSRRPLTGSDEIDLGGESKMVCHWLKWPIIVAGAVVAQGGIITHKEYV